MKKDFPKEGFDVMSVSDHKCPACDAELNFDPKTQKWICEYCGSEYSLQDLKMEEDNQKKQKQQTKKSSNISYNGYHCPDCGAEIVMDENTSVTECVYCGNTAIINERLEGEFAPKQIIPFKKDKKDAVEAFSCYRKWKWFMPKEFLQKKNIEKISGIYIPFYLYDLDVAARINVQATKSQVWSDRNYRYTRTDYFDVAREGNMTFKMVPTDASKKFPDDIMDSIEPYNYKELVDFDSSYISGFLSEKYDLTIDELSERAERRAEKSAEEALLRDIHGYDTKTVRSSVQKSKRKNSSKYVLLPVWMLNVKYNEKIYTLAMNGQTGKFIGNVPISKKKVVKYWFGIFFGVSVIALIFNFFGLLNLLG